MSDLSVKSATHNTSHVLEIEFSDGYVGCVDFAPFIFCSGQLKESKGLNKCFTKSQETIKQYYHEIDEIITLSGLEFVSSDDVSLYEMEEADKVFLVLQKR